MSKKIDTLELGNTINLLKSIECEGYMLNFISIEHPEKDYYYIYQRVRYGLHRHLRELSFQDMRHMISGLFIKAVYSSKDWDNTVNLISNYGSELQIVSHLLYVRKKDFLDFQAIKIGKSDAMENLKDLG